MWKLKFDLYRMKTTMICTSLHKYHKCKSCFEKNMLFSIKVAIGNYVASNKSLLTATFFSRKTPEAGAGGCEWTARGL